MDICNMVYDSSGVCTTGNSSFIRQCFAYLATCDLLFLVVGVGSLVLLWLIFDFIVKMMED